ncbi:MAG: formyltransferase family protein [Pseudomonadota bacterium]
MTTIGAVCSGGGSALVAAYPFFEERGLRLTVVTDRACGIEDFCRAETLLCTRIDEGCNDRFSTRANEVFRRADVSAVFLYYDRLIGPALYDEWACINFHPSLLPAFQGFHALEKAIEMQVSFLGQTCHIADASVDAGPILAQCIYPMERADYNIKRAMDISFVQKLALTLSFAGQTAERLPVKDFVEWWRGLPSSGPGGFLNPNVLTDDAKQLVLQHATRKHIRIEL